MPTSLADARTARPSNVRLIVESIVVAVLSVIVTKLAAVLMGGDVSSAILGGVAAGAVTVWLSRRTRKKRVG